MSDVTGPDLCHCLATRRAARMLSRLYDRHLAPEGINISQFALLSCLGTNAEITAAALAARMMRKRTTLVRALKPLRATNLVHAATESGIELRYRLTAKGKRALKRAVPLWNAAQNEYELMFDRKRVEGLRGELLALTSSAST